MTAVGGIVDRWNIREPPHLDRQELSNVSLIRGVQMRDSLTDIWGRLRIRGSGEIRAIPGNRRQGMPRGLMSQPEQVECVRILRHGLTDTLEEPNRGDQVAQDPN